MGQTCCGARTTSKAIDRLVGSEKFRKGEADTKVAEELWEIYAGKDSKDVSLEIMQNSTVHSDYLTAQKILIKKHVGETLQGYTEDEDGAKKMEEEKDQRKKVAKQLLDGIAVHMTNDGTIVFCAQLFGMKEAQGDSKTKIVIGKLTKEDFIKRYCESVKMGIARASGHQLDLDKLEEEKKAAAALKDK